MNTETTELCRCPWCGARAFYEAEHRAVKCPQCDMRGPTFNSRQEAVTAWNQIARALNGESDIEKAGGTL